MANVIKTVLTYPLDGSTTNFNIPFEYLARKFVVVTLLGVDRRVLTVTTDYRFATRTVIVTNKAWGPADGYTQIEIRRVTSATERLVDFTDGSILRAYDLNVAQIQTMHVAEEARNMTADTIGVNNDGHLDARGRRIVNVAYATSDYDAVPLKQIKEREFSAWNAVTKANEHADHSNMEANRSRDEANRAQREADRSTQQAGVSMQQAVESKKQADRSGSEANRAKDYADGMTASVAEAKEQADRSNSEANRASDDANRAAGEVTKAAAEVAKAATHVETAKGHADRANIEANRSKGEADRAKSEADKLANINGFSQTITEVAPTHIKFNRNLVAEAMNVQTAAGKPPVVQVRREGIGELLMTVDGQGNKGFQPSLGSDFMGYWNPAGDTYVSSVSNNIDLGNRVIRGSLKVQKEDSSSFSLTDTAANPAVGSFVSSTQYGWFSGSLSLGTVRGGSKNSSSGLIRHVSDGNSIGADIWLTPDSGMDFIKFGQSGGIVNHRFSKDGNIFMGFYNDWLSNVIGSKAPRRWSGVSLGSMPITNDAVLNLPFDVRGLRGFFGFVGGQGETVYNQFTFPPLDCRFQLNRKGDWQIFELTNKGTRLIRRYGWNEGNDPYNFYCESSSS